MEIVSMRYSLDWVSPQTHEINPEEIFGFELHWRLGSWCVVVKTKEKCKEGYYSYELSHWVMFQEVVKLISNPETKILSIVNYHNSDDFLPNLIKLIKAVEDED